LTKSLSPVEFAPSLAKHRYEIRLKAHDKVFNLKLFYGYLSFFKLTVDGSNKSCKMRAFVSKTSQRKQI